jgi:hypothetical protein
MIPAAVQEVVLFLDTDSLSVSFSWLFFWTFTPSPWLSRDVFARFQGIHPVSIQVGTKHNGSNRGLSRKTLLHPPLPGGYAK